jgi:tripartite-type tricarboxylate transporter receptor subunit TctC
MACIKLQTGYAILIANPSSQSVNPVINRNIGYSPERDFAPITKVTSSPPVQPVRRMTACLQTSPCWNP